MAKVKVYRVGKVEVGQHNEEILDFWGAMDAMKPKSHPTGRSNAIYVSPNAHGLLRWVRGNIPSRTPLEVHEVTVDSDDVFVYEVLAYERVSTDPANRTSERFTDATKRFWDSGMTLTEWLECASPEDGHDYEILLNPAKIISSKKLTHRMVVNCIVKVAKYESDVEEVKDAKHNFID